MARKGRIEIGASVTVGAKEDGSLSAIEKRIEKLSNEEIEIKINDATKDLKELEKMEKKVGGNIAASIAARRKELADSIELYKQEQKLRADGLKQTNQEVKVAKELQKVEKKRIEAKEKKNGEPTKREQELINITKVLQGIRGAVNVFDDLSIEKAKERLHQFNDLLDECQVKLDAMKRLRKGNERTMYDTTKSEIADLKRTLGAIQALKDQTPSIKPKIEKKEKEVEKEKPKKTNAPTPKPAKDNSAEVIQQQASAAKQQARNLEQVNAELKKERENLAAIEQAQNRNDAAREALQRKRANYSGEALQSNKAVYDTDKLAAATEGLRTFNSELEKRNQFMERYKQLYRIVQGSFVGQYSISNGIYADMDQFISDNPAMRELDSLAKNGIKGISTKHINELFTSVANSLRREASEIQRMINSESVLGAKVIAELDQEEIRLGQEQQRLYDEREAQLTRINALHREEMDLIAQKGREEKKNTQTTQKTMEDFQKLWGEVSKKYSAKDFGKKYGHLMEAISGKNPTMSIDEAYDELERREKERQKELDAESRKRAAITTEMTTFMSFANSIQTEINASEKAVKEYSDILTEISKGALSGADAIERMRSAMQDAREEQTQIPATQILAKANNELAESYLKVQEAAKKSLDATSGNTFATILKYYKELLKAPQDNEIVAEQKALIEKAFDGVTTPGRLNAVQYLDDSELRGMGNKLMLGASFEGEFLFGQISAYLQNITKSTIDWSKALGSVEQSDDAVKSRISNLITQANQIPQAENTTRFVHFTDANNNQSIFENGLRMVNQRLNTTVLSLQEYQDALNGVGETYASVIGITKQHGNSDNAVLLDIPNDSIMAYTATTGNLETVSRSFVRATVDTKNGLCELNAAYDASHDVVSEYTDAIREAKAEEDGMTSRRPGLKRSASLEALQNQILENRKKLVAGQVERAEEQLSVEQQITAEKEKQNELIAMHGISTKNLLNALDQGAFPSPSIALTKPDVYSGGYGDATVVFKKSAIDPALNPANKIYGVDAYTPTHPSFGYELNNEALAKAAERTGIALDELRMACDGAYESADEAAKKLANSTGLGDKLQEAFIKERGFAINKTETSGSIKNRFHVISDDEITNGVPAFIAQNGMTFDKIVNDDAIQKAYFDAIDEYVANLNEYFADFIPGQIKQALVDEYKDTIRNARIDKDIYDTEKEFFENDQAVIRGENKIIDVAAYNDEVQKIINNNRKEYNTYVKEILGSFMIKPNVKGANGQRFDRTPEGIAEAMSTYGGKGALYDQDAFIRRSIDLQSFIIAASKSYKNLDEVVLDMARLQKDAAGTHTLSNTDYSISGITSAIAQANNMRDEEVFDKILRAVDGNSTAEAIGKALADNGLTVEGSTIEKIAALAQEALKVPTRYFEAKPQRTLGLGDIDYVAIPKDSANAAELRAKLQEKGIKYVEHTSTDKDSRLAALQAGMQQNWAVPMVEGTKAVETAAETTSAAAGQLAQGIQQVGDTAQQTTQQLKQQTTANNALAESTERVAGASEQTAQRFEEMVTNAVAGEAVDIIEQLRDNYGAQQPTLEKLTASEVKSVFGDGILDNILKDYNIKGQDADKVYEIVTEMAQIIKTINYDVGNNVDPSAHMEQLDECTQRTAKALMTLGSESIEASGDLKDFYERMRNVKIKYNDGQRAEYSSDWRNKIARPYGRYLTKSTTGIPADILYRSLLEEFPGLFSEDIKGDIDQFVKIFDVLGEAIALKKNNWKYSGTFGETIPDAQEFVMGQLYELQGTIMGRIMDSAASIGDVVANTNQEIQEGAAATTQQISGQIEPLVVPIQPYVESNEVEGAIQESTGGDKVEVPVKPVVDEEEAKERLSIIERDVKNALEQLRSAKNSDKALINFEGAFTRENLLKQFQNFAQNIDGLDLNVGQIKVHGDTAQVQLYNDELKVTVDQIWRLKEASEGADRALEFVDQSFVQNVKALNANNFDVDGIRARAQASIEKLRSSLHGLEYDLTDLEDAAKTISSKDDFNKFNNQLKAAQDNVQAMRNAVVSKSSLNQLANMQRDMKNANTELETMRINLQKIGEINGIEKARNIITDMQTAVGDFNNATDAKAQEKAYNQYSDLRSQFGTQLKLLNATKSAGLTGFFDTDKNNQLIEFSRWESNIKNIGMLSDETSQRIQNMSDALSQVRDSNELQKWTIDFKKLKEEVSYESTSQDTKSRIAEIKDSLIAQKKELETLYNNVDLGSATDTQGVNVREAYQQAVDEINRCIEAIGRCSQEEVAAAAAAGATAKQRIEEYASVKDFYEQMAQNENAKTGDDAIRNYYQTINSAIQQIAKLESQINSLKLKADGSAMYTSLIAGLEDQRNKLVSQVQDTAAQISSAFNDNFVITNNVELPYSTILDNLIDPTTSNTIKNFFGDLYVQEALGEKAINNFSQTLQNAQTKAEQFANTLNEKFETVRQSASALLELQKLGAVDANNKLYKNAQSKIGLFTQYNESLSGKDPSTWSAGETINWQRLANDAITYSQSVEAAIQKEAKYFANKKQYANISNLQDYDKAANNMDAMSESTRKAKQVLEEYVNGFEGGKKIITGFTTSANGISKINFAMFEEGTNQFRTFSAEMGQFSNNIYTYETSMKNLTSGTDAAMKSLDSLSAVMSRLNNIEGTEDIRNNLRKTMEELSDAVNAPDASTAAGQMKLKNLAADAERAVKSASKLEQQWIKTQAAIDNGDLKNLGQIDKNGNIQSQMWDLIKSGADGARASFVGFNDSTNTLTYTLTNADGTVTTMTAHMHGLNSTVTTQQGETKKLASGWQEFTGGIGGALKGLKQYAGRMFSTWAIVSQLKKGFSAVKEIDASLTELKKVTDETESSYRKFLNTASQTAGDIGSTVSDFTEATANFARLGYTMEESAKMAETAIVYKNVADGLDTVEESTESIISTMKAFGIESNDTMGIVDRFNEVGVVFCRL